MATTETEVDIEDSRCPIQEGVPKGRALRDASLSVFDRLVADSASGFGPLSENVLSGRLCQPPLPRPDTLLVCVVLSTIFSLHDAQRLFALPTLRWIATVEEFLGAYTTKLYPRKYSHVSMQVTQNRHSQKFLRRQEDFQPLLTELCVRDFSCTMLLRPALLAIASGFRPRSDVHPLFLYLVLMALSTTMAFVVLYYSLRSLR